MSETYEYGYLYILNASELIGPGIRGWISIVQDASGSTVYGEDRETALAPMNALGQQGWFVGDAPTVPVDNNEIPTFLRPIVVGKFGGFGIIHSIQRRYMYRRVVWPDDRPH